MLAFQITTLFIRRMVYYAADFIAMSVTNLRPSTGNLDQTLLASAAKCYESLPDTI